MEVQPSEFRMLADMGLEALKLLYSSFKAGQICEADSRRTLLHVAGERNEAHKLEVYSRVYTFNSSNFFLTYFIHLWWFFFLSNYIIFVTVGVFHSGCYKGTMASSKRQIICFEHRCTLLHWRTRAGPYRLCCTTAQTQTLPTSEQPIMSSLPKRILIAVHWSVGYWLIVCCLIISLSLRFE